MDALDKNVLSGAKFNLEDAFGNIVVKDLVSDEDGIIQSSVKTRNILFSGDNGSTWI